MQIASRISEGYTIFDISGDIDLAHSPQMRKALLGEIKEKRVPKVFLNLKNVRYIDSSGIASLVEGLKASRDTGSRLILYSLSNSVREVMQLSRLQKIFEILMTSSRRSLLRCSITRNILKGARHPWISLEKLARRLSIPLPTSARLAILAGTLRLGDDFRSFSSASQSASRKQLNRPWKQASVRCPFFP